MVVFDEHQTGGARNWRGATGSVVTSGRSRTSREHGDVGKQKTERGSGLQEASQADSAQVGATHPSPNGASEAARPELVP